jgi:hypothetical protein
MGATFRGDSTPANGVNDELAGTARAVMFALVIALGALVIAIVAGAILDPRPHGGDADDYGPVHDEIALSR